MMLPTVAEKVVRAAPFNKSSHIHPPPTCQCDRRCGGGASSQLEALESVFAFDDDWRRSREVSETLLLNSAHHPWGAGRTYLPPATRRRVSQR